MSNNTEDSSDSDDFDDDDETPAKEPCDVGSYTLEEKIVAAVWVHERIKNNQSWNSIMKNFKIRFGAKPPAKRTFKSWERKLFSEGNVRDAIRTGRPCARLMHIPYVKASIAEFPNLSLRERAQELGLPRSTLLKILKDDLKMTFVPTAEPESTDSEKNRSFPKKRKASYAQTGVWKYNNKIGTKPKSQKNKTGNDESEFNVSKNSCSSDNSHEDFHNLPPYVLYSADHANSSQLQPGCSSLQATLHTFYQTYHMQNESYQ